MLMKMYQHNDIAKIEKILNEDLEICDWFVDNKSSILGITKLNKFFLKVSDGLKIFVILNIGYTKYKIN